MSKLEAARKCREMLLRKEAAANTEAQRKALKIKLDQMRAYICSLHREARELSGK